MDGQGTTSGLGGPDGLYEYESREAALLAG
jgi:hypothetical protein